MDGFTQESNMKISFTDVCEYELHKFCTEASSLGLKPGEWPNSFDTEMGNKQPFIRQQAIMHKGEFAGVAYRQQLGCITLHVLND
jgi:hypothetical protein